MVNTCRASVTIICMLLWGHPALATSARAIYPAENIREAQVEVLIGEAIGEEEYPNLFDGLAGRRAFLSTTLKQEIETALSASGISTDSKSDDAFLVGIWGHQDTTLASGRIFVYLIRLTVVDYDYDSAAECESERHFELTSEAIGAAGIDDLEETLTSEVLRLLDEQLASRVQQIFEPQ